MSSLSSFHPSPPSLLLLFIFLLLPICLSDCLSDRMKWCTKIPNGETRREGTSPTESGSRNSLAISSCFAPSDKNKAAIFCRLSKGAHRRQKASYNEAAMALGRVRASTKATLWQTLMRCSHLNCPSNAFFHLSLSGEKKQL